MRIKFVIRYSQQHTQRGKETWLQHRESIMKNRGEVIHIEFIHVHNYIYICTINIHICTQRALEREPSRVRE